MKHLQLSSLFIVAIIAILVFSGYHDPRPEVRSSDSSEQFFSAERAFVHVKNMTEKPHPVGSEYHGEVIAYLAEQLKSLGLETEVDTQINFEEQFTGRPALVKTKNVIAQWKGTDPQYTILFNAHHDSVAQAAGAGDNTSAVAAILEVVRALKTGPAPKHNLVFLFSDAEELGLNGALSFVSRHPLAKEIDYVINIDGRGNSGFVGLFQSSKQNLSDIKAISSWLERPIGYSIAQEIYDRMPNDTDFTVLQNLENFRGLNFAHVGNGAVYHSSEDNVENLDLQLLQHQGEILFQIAKNIGAEGLPEKSAKNAVFFNLPFLGFFHYSEALNIPIFVIAFCFFFGAVMLSIKEKRLSIKKLLVSFGHILASLVLIAVFGFSLQKLFLTLGSKVFEMHLPYDLLSYYFATLWVITGAIWAWFLVLGRIQNPLSLQVGACFLWLILAGLTVFMVPGAANFYALPSMFLGLLLIFSVKTEHVAFYGLAGLVAIFMHCNFLSYFYEAMGPQMTLPFALQTMISFLPVIGLFSSSSAEKQRWRWPGLVALLGLVFFGVTTAKQMPPSEKAPIQTSLAYGLDLDEGNAFWLSRDRELSDWSSTYLEDHEIGTMAPFNPGSRSRYIKAKAPIFQMQGPRLEVVGEDENYWTIQLSSPDAANQIWVYPDPAWPNEISVNGHNLAKNSKSLFIAGLANNPIEFQVSKDEGLALRVTEKLFGLPKEVSPRPQGYIGRPDRLSDTMMVTKRFVLQSPTTTSAENP